MRGGRHGPGDHHRTRRRLTGIEQTGSPARDIAVKLGVIARQMRIAFDRDVAKLGVTRSQWMVIIVAARHPGATQRVIADALEMTEAAAGRLIDKLCGEGLLERRPKPDDRRAHSVHLTAKAEPILAKLGEFGERNEARVFAGMSPAELVQLDALLGRVYDNVLPPRV